jgi:hypothetical protein
VDNKFLWQGNILRFARAEFPEVGKKHYLVAGIRGSAVAHANNLPLFARMCLVT